MEQSTPKKFITEIPFFSFAAKHSIVATYFLFSVEQEKLVDKNLASKIWNVCEI